MSSSGLISDTGSASGPAAHAPSAKRPARVTAALTALLAVTASLLCLIAPDHEIFPVHVPGPVAFALLVVGFFLGEQLLMSVEFRHEAHVATLAGIPLVLAVLILPLPLGLLARMLGAGAALVFQRTTVQKTAYNISAWAFELAVDVTCVHGLVGSTSRLTLTDFAAILVVIVVVDAIVNVLVLVVITIHGGTVRWPDVRSALGPGTLLAVVSSAMSVGLLQLLKLGPLGGITVLVVALVMLILYRGYVRATRRHQRLELVHDFVTEDTGSASFDVVAAALLARLRALMRAGTVRLVLVDEHAGGTMHRRVVNGYVDDGNGFVTFCALAPLDWITVRALEGEPLLATRSTKDDAVRAWLRQHAYRDAIVIPLPAHSGLVGTLTVSDRLGETASFTADDVTLLQTLVGHLVVAGRSAQLVERLAHDATHDPLTGLVNRSEFARRVDDALAAGEAGNCLLLLDLDRFKEVNDGLGHAAGDVLLRVVARRLVDHLPAAAVVARLGGDEFAVLLTAHGDEEGMRADLLRLAEAVARPVVVDEAMLTPDASIGVAPATAGVTSGDLLRRADVAMYAAKTHGHSVTFFHPDFDRDRAEDLALLADLRLALRQSPEQIDVYYQPKIELATRSVVGAEALIRWNHPTRGVVGPDRFVPLAERAGLVDQFVPIVLDRALADCRRWRHNGFDLRVAVNLSARNVGDPALPDRVGAALARAHVAPSSLILEITESSIIDDPQQSLQVLDRIAGQGVAISLDDFGTGYSSLSYLQRLPVSEVKIDRSFVAGLDSADRRSSRTLIASIADLGENLGLSVVAEGAESAAVLDELSALGCHVAQGFCVSHPLPGAEFAVWLEQYCRPAASPELTLVTGASEVAL